MDPTALSASSPARRTPPRPPSPALATPAKPNNGTPAPLLDMSIASAVFALAHHLVQPLGVHYPHAKLMDLRAALSSLLTEHYQRTWNESNPHVGSGSRSLIACHEYGLPRLLKVAAKQAGVDHTVWNRAIAAGRKRRAAAGEDEDEWEVWCDPGMVVWRWGGWGWDEAEFDPIKRPRESYHVIWQAAPTTETVSSPATATPARSKAIPIRAPSLLHIPATPSPAPSAGAIPAAMPRSPSPLLPAADILPPMSRHVRNDSEDMRRPTHSRNGSFARHKGQASTSSTSSDSSDTGSQTQLLTPASRPGSADIFPGDKGSLEETPRGRDRSPGSARGSEPTVTPYDGGNVTVLGGGTKLGGSRPSSVLGRTRSPSVNIASRALATAVGPNANAPAGRKPRTRRRIIPTHIGYFGQPGVGAPMMGAFGAAPAGAHKHQPGQPPFAWPGAPAHVGVGMAPPQIGQIFKR